MKLDEMPPMSSVVLFFRQAMASMISDLDRLMSENLNILSEVPYDTTSSSVKLETGIDETISLATFVKKSIKFLRHCHFIRDYGIIPNNLLNGIIFLFNIINCFA
jgi:hypothetical protein